MAFETISAAEIDADSPLSTDLFSKIKNSLDFLNTQVAALAAGLILVEKKLITGDVTSVSFTGLDGDTDEVYKLFGRIVMSTTANFYSLQPNGISANQDEQSVQDYGTGGGSATTTRLLLARSQSSSGVLVTFESTFWAKKNPNAVAVNRALQSQYSFFTATGPETEGPGIAESLWDDDTTNVTSLDVVSANASDIRDGSTIALYKMRQS